MTRSLTRRSLLAGLGGIAAATALPGLARAQTALVLQLPRPNSVEFAGYYLATDKKRYEAQGVTAALLPGGAGVDGQAMVVSGTADLALTSPAQAIRAITEDGAPLKIIGAQFQKSPLGIVSLGAASVPEPEALSGKRLGVRAADTATVRAFLEANGIDAAGVTLTPWAGDADALIEGKLDAVAGSVVTLPYRIRQSGAVPVSFLLHDHGLPVFGDVLVASTDGLAAKRAAMIGFLRASRHGWDQDLAAPADWPPTWQQSWLKDAKAPPAAAIAANIAQKPLISSGFGIFALDEDAVDACLDALGRTGLKGREEMFDGSLLDDI